MSVTKFPLLKHVYFSVLMLHIRYTSIVKQTANIVLSLQFFKGVIGNKSNNIVSLSTQSPVAPDNYISKVLRCFPLIHKSHQDILWSSSQKLSMFCEFDFCHILGM